MHLGCAIGEEVLGEKLARVGSGLGRQALLLSGHLAWNIARRILAAVQGKQRFAITAIE